MAVLDHTEASKNELDYQDTDSALPNAVCIHMVCYYILNNNVFAWLEKSLKEKGLCGAKVLLLQHQLSHETYASTEYRCSCIC